ncbi:stage II sporulation protein M [Nocardiopsis protaetiae]|uniref:stage II sporulation protein M n=1 Tax=Nocardiopsis protaetiae TaxID=3382270 RepID=UPI00387AECEA
MRHLRTPFRIIRENLRAYLVMNAVVYGALLLGIGAGLLFPDLYAAQHAALEEAGTAEQIRPLLATPWLFALVILANNVLRASLLSILLPSMVVPFSGIALFAYTTFTIGVIVAPVDGAAARTLVPHSVTLLVEFQAYVLLMLAAYLLGRAWLRPRTVGADTRRRGYVHGLKQVGWLSLPALALLVVGAVYEALSVLHLM